MLHEFLTLNRDAIIDLTCVAAARRPDMAARVDALRNGVEEPGDTAPHDLRIGPGHEPRRVHDVDEQHGCELSLHV